VTTFYTNSGNHADGDNKIIYILMIYFPSVLAEKTICAGKTSGKANMKNLQELGLKLNQEDLKLVTNVLLRR
jgi:D-citramalate synthase